MGLRARLVLPCLALALAACADASPADRAVVPPSHAPLRVLVLSGGGYHDFAGNLAILLPAVAARRPVSFTQIELHPADKATPADAAALDALDWPATFDAILDYTQGALAI